MPARLAGDVGRHRAELLDRLTAAGMRPLDQVGAIEALQLLHAPEDARLEVHDAVGVGEIARQLGERAVDLAGSLAEIALLERDLVRTARPSSTAPRRGRRRAARDCSTDRPSASARYFSIAFSVRRPGRSPRRSPRTDAQAAAIRCRSESSPDRSSGECRCFQALVSRRRIVGRAAQSPAGRTDARRHNTCIFLDGKAASLSASKAGGGATSKSTCNLPCGSLRYLQRYEYVRERMLTAISTQCNAVNVRNGSDRASAWIAAPRAD